ncbi:type II 3-dehydroquinate dehydratase [Corynebacterium massiliense]|uniref:type II 3-dehydroquinate dehydratase n=1 Tax=Corynebacterium massiliense TaxID=441501 RepID=UPI0023571856|nr:type II 3-dehydroquinate dehydratase [Corynebacterium massiliense]
MRISVINGPNLNRLGRREPDIYGAATLADIEKLVRDKAAGLGVEVEWMQSNHEGELIEAAHRAADENLPVVVNAGGLTHTSVALRDALAEVADGAGFIEVHLSNVHARDPFRHTSLLSDIARGVIVGLGPCGYVAAVEHFAHAVNQKGLA